MSALEHSPNTRVWDTEDVSLFTEWDKTNTIFENDDSD